MLLIVTLVLFVGISTTGFAFRPHPWRAGAY